MKMHIKNKLLIIMAVILMVNLLTPVAYASSGWLDGLKDGASNLWNAAKDKGSEIIDTVKEEGPGWVESGKEAISSAVDTAGSAIQDAQQQFSEWNTNQQQQFWDRTTTQIYGSTPTPEQAQALESVQPVSSAQPESSTDSKAVSSFSPPPGETPGVIPSADEAHETASALPEPTPEIFYYNPDPIPAPDLAGTLFYNGQWYRRVEDDGDIWFNGELYAKADNVVQYYVISDNVVIVDGNIVKVDDAEEIPPEETEEISSEETEAAEIAETKHELTEEEDANITLLFIWLGIMIAAFIGSMILMLYLSL